MKYWGSVGFVAPCVTTSLRKLQFLTNCCANNIAAARKKLHLLWPPKTQTPGISNVTANITVPVQDAAIHISHTCRVWRFVDALEWHRVCLAVLLSTTHVTCADACDAGSAERTCRNRAAAGIATGHRYGILSYKHVVSGIYKFSQAYRDSISTPLLHGDPHAKFVTL